MLDHRPEHSLGGGTPWQFGMLPETLILSQTKIPKGVGTPENSLWGCATRFSKSRPYFRPKNVIFHTRLQNRSLKSTPFSDLAFRQKLRYHYLDQSANKKFFKAISNSHISLSFLLIWNWKDKYVLSCTPVVPPKTIPDSRQKWAKCISVLRPKRRKNPTRSGDTYLYSLYKGVPPRDQNMWFFFLPYFLTDSLFSSENKTLLYLRPLKYDVRAEGSKTILFGAAYTIHSYGRTFFECVAKCMIHITEPNDRADCSGCFMINVLLS